MEEQGLRAPDGSARLIDTQFEVGRDNVQRQIGPIDLDVHRPVFGISFLTIAAFVFLTLALPDHAAAVFEWLRQSITASFDWFFISVANLFVLVCVGLIFTPLGNVRLGGQDAVPDYSYLGWFPMLFAAGMGIGLMFFGISEPISHYTAAVSEDAGSPESWAPLEGAAGDEDAARRLGMAATIYHWALHAWAIYALVALSLALFAYNKGLPLSMRSMFHPLLGERVWGWPGHVIDTLAVFATLFGLATSLGIGAEQAIAGLSFLFGLPTTDTAKVFLVLSVTSAALVSVMLGLDRGVKRLSEINISLAALLLVFVVAVGPTSAIATGFFANLLSYAETFGALSNPFGRNDDNFRHEWTSFYWAWWISWSPFVGMFIARVSRGRTVREFIVCVLLIPSLVSILWMTAFGGTGITQLIDLGYRELAGAPLELQLFLMLEPLPLTAITSFLGITLVIVFFITSSDSGSLVVDTITAGGKIDGPKVQRAFWCALEGLVAIALTIGGGLAALQAASISTGLPFAVVLVLATYCLIRGLMDERRRQAGLVANQPGV